MLERILHFAEVPTTAGTAACVGVGAPLPRWRSAWPLSEAEQASWGLGRKLAEVASHVSSWFAWFVACGLRHGMPLRQLQPRPSLMPVGPFPPSSATWRRHLWRLC